VYGKQLDSKDISSTASGGSGRSQSLGYTFRMPLPLKMFFKLVVAVLIISSSFADAECSSEQIQKLRVEIAEKAVAADAVILLKQGCECGEMEFCRHLTEVFSNNLSLPELLSYTDKVCASGSKEYCARAKIYRDTQEGMAKKNYPYNPFYKSKDFVDKTGQFKNLEQKEKIREIERVISTLRSGIKLQYSQQILRCGGKNGAWPSLSALRMNDITEGRTSSSSGLCSTLNVQNADERTFVFSGRTKDPLIDFSDIADCSNCTDQCNCAAVSEARHAWCYNQQTGNFWSTSKKDNMCSF
jgi:hypothetical protein